FAREHLRDAAVRVEGELDVADVDVAVQDQLALRRGVVVLPEPRAGGERHEDDREDDASLVHRGFLAFFGAARPLRRRSSCASRWRRRSGGSRSKAWKLCFQMMASSKGAITMRQA